MAVQKRHSQNVGKLWSEDQAVGKRWSERPKRASRRKTVVTCPVDGTCPVNGQHVRNCENSRKLGENMDGRLKTVIRGKIVERVSSTPNASGTVHPSLKLGENVDGNAKTVNRDKVRRNVSQHVRYG